MTKKIEQIISLHPLFLDGKDGGVLANFSNEDLAGFDFSRKNLSNANFKNANLSNANFVGANLYRANFQEANLQNANLEGVNLNSANLEKANLREANLQLSSLEQANLRMANLNSTNLEKANLRAANLQLARLEQANLFEANLHSANLKGARLVKTNLQGACIIYANLEQANLREANLQEASLSRTNLNYTDLSMTIGILNPLVWLKENFEFVSEGIIVYKSFNAAYNPNPNWKIEDGSVIEEVVNLNPTTDCGCGINFATKEWCKEYYPESTLWKCLLKYEDLANLCVPYNTDGNARCGSLTLLQIV